MRHRLVEVLEKDAQDEPMEPGLYRFWSRGKALRVERSPADAQVIDLARWAEARRADLSGA